MPASVSVWTPAFAFNHSITHTLQTSSKMPIVRCHRSRVTCRRG